MFLSNGSMNRRLAFLHWLRLGEVRQLLRYYQDAMTPCRRPAALRFLRLAVPRFHSLCSLSGRRVDCQSLELVTRYLQPGFAEERTGFSQVPGEPRMSVCTCSNPTPAGLLAPDHYGAAAWPLVCKKQRLPRKVFRRSIAWLSDSLSTLRSASYPNTTQNSLPVAGQALLDGTPTRKVPLKGFKGVDYISSPLPKLRLAQLHRPLKIATRANSQRCLFSGDTSVDRPELFLQEDCPTDAN